VSLNNRSSSWALALGLSALSWVASSAVQAQKAPARPVNLSIMTTNDVHGRISQLPLFGGYVENVRAARAKDGGAVLLLDAGDIFQGTIESNSTEGASMVRAFRALGYDAVTLGNHEFDFGPVGPHAVPITPKDDPLGALKARVAQSPLPFLNANLRGPQGKPLAIPKLRASILLRPRGVPVGIVGGVTKDVLRTTHADNTRGVEVLPLASAIAEQAQGLRTQGARVVIAVVHAGGECRALENPDDLASCDAHAEAFELARALPAGLVDVIVAGHTHSGLAQRVNGIALVEAFSNGRAFGRVDIAVPASASEPLSIQIKSPHGLCKEDLDQPSCAQPEQYEGLPVQRSPKVLKAIAADMQAAKAARERSTGIEVVSEVKREHKRESPLNNLVADLMLRATPGADAAFSNAGGVRISLPKGPLRYGTVFEMFPFDNSFAILKLTAAQLAGILAQNLRSDNGILALAGLTAAASCKDHQLQVQLFDSAGKALAPERALTVATSDFLAASGDGTLAGQQLPADAIHIERDRVIRDAILDGLTVYPGGKLDGADKRLFDPAAPRLRYEGARPLRCN
jgi:2',3'-cyclic-nucleotide 2'-phosphodiesterase (5'-nucleotidase family)